MSQENNLTNEVLMQLIYEVCVKNLDRRNMIRNFESHDTKLTVGKHFLPTRKISVTNCNGGAPSEVVSLRE